MTIPAAQAGTSTGGTTSAARCDQCGKPLSRYNPDIRCSACQHATRLGNGAAPAPAGQAAKQRSATTRPTAPPTSRGDDERPHGPHVAELAEGSGGIDWRKVADPMERIVGVMVQQTCPCRPVQFELLRHGGMRLIRRTSLQGSRETVHQTPPMPVAAADALWQQLLAGQAR